MSLKSNTIFFVYSFSNEFQLFRTIGIGFGWGAVDWFEFCVRKWLVVEQWAGKPAAGVLTNHESSYVSGFPHWQMNVKKIMPALPGNIKMFKNGVRSPQNLYQSRAPPTQSTHHPMLRVCGLVWFGRGVLAGPLPFPDLPGLVWTLGGPNYFFFTFFYCRAIPLTNDNSWLLRD